MVVLVVALLICILVHFDLFVALLICILVHFDLFVALSICILVHFDLYDVLCSFVRSLVMLNFNYSLWCPLT